MTEFIQPFGDKVLVKILVPEAEVAGGLLVAPVSKEKSNKGLVIAVGEGTTLQDGTVRPLQVNQGMWFYLPTLQELTLLQVMQIIRLLLQKIY